MRQTSGSSVNGLAVILTPEAAARHSGPKLCLADLRPVAHDRAARLRIASTFRAVLAEAALELILQGKCTAATRAGLRPRRAQSAGTIDVGLAPVSGLIRS